nr:hypothetical protein [Rhodococcus sp. DMF-1]
MPWEQEQARQALNALRDGTDIFDVTVAGMADQVGSALGLAATTAVAAAYGADRLGDLPALTDGFSAAFLGAGAIAIALLGAIAALVTMKAPAREDTLRLEEPASTTN